MNATIVDLRYNMKNVLRAIDGGETVTVLYRGKERAKLTPITPALSSGTPRTKNQPLFGLWKDREEMDDPTPYLRDLRLPRASAKANITKQPRSRKLK